MDRWKDLPFESFRSGEDPTVVWVREGYAASLHRVGIQHSGSLLGDGGDRRGGRGPVALLTLPDRPGEQVVLKRYRRGGLPGKILPDLFLGTGRFRWEFRLAEEALRRGLPIPEPLALVRQGRWGLFRVYGVTRKIPATKNLLELLETPVPASRWRDLIRVTARAVRKIQDQGLSHEDLNLSNLLVSETEAPLQVHFVDLGGSRLLPELPLRQRLHALKRLRRSWEKHLFSRNRRPGSELARFLLDYGSGDPGLLDALRRWNLWDRLGMAFHRMGWRLAEGIRSGSG